MLLFSKYERSAKWESLSRNPFTIINQTYKLIIKKAIRKPVSNLSNKVISPSFNILLFMKQDLKDAFEVSSPLADGRSHKARVVTEKSTAASSFTASYISAEKKRWGGYVCWC